MEKREPGLRQESQSVMEKPKHKWQVEYRAGGLRLRKWKGKAGVRQRSLEQNRVAVVVVFNIPGDSFSAADGKAPQSLESVHLAGTLPLHD